MATSTQAPSDSESKKIKIAVLNSALTNADRRAITSTLQAIQSVLGKQKLEVSFYNPSQLENKLKEGEVNYFFGTAGFYRRFEHTFELSGIATLFTQASPDPRFGTSSVFIVRKDSPIKEIPELKGKVALASWSRGFSSFFAPMAEIAERGYDPDNFFSKFKTYGPPLQNLLDRLENKEGDVVLLRACMLEDFAEKDPGLLNKFRILNERDDGLLRCKHSTQVYPHWTFVAAKGAPWRVTKELTRILLTIPEKEKYGWAVVPDFKSIDNMYRKIKRGPYEYLRIQTVGDFFYQYRYWIILLLLTFLGLFLHSWRAEILVKKRTLSLRKSWKKERKLRQKIADSERRIEELQKTEIIGAMSSLIAHEINGPIATIDNYVRGINRKLESENKKSWISYPLKVISRQTEKISQIVSQVRSYAKNSSAEPVEIDVKSSLEEYVENILLRKPQAKIRLDVDKNYVISAQPFEFEVLIENLLRNALQAQETFNLGRSELNEKVAVFDEPVSLAARQEGNKLEITLRNVSHFSSQAELDEELKRTLASKKGKGLGIGLLICRTIVEKMRGNLTLSFNNGYVITTLKLPLLNTEQDLHNFDRGNRGQDAHKNC